MGRVNSATIIEPIESCNTSCCSAVGIKTTVTKDGFLAVPAVVLSRFD